VLAACSFSPPGEVTTDAAGATDAKLEIDASGGATAVVPCATPDASGLVLCLELEDGVDDGTLRDSAPGHHDAATAGLSPDSRSVPISSQAARVGATSVTRVAEDPALDLDASYTLGVWVRPETLPPEGTVYGLLDHELQYAMLIGHSAIDGTLQDRCVHTGVADFEFTEGLTAGEWSFLACTWDGSELCAYRWTSAASHQRFCHVAFAPNVTGAQGLAIGHLSAGGAPHSRFDGELDSIQVYSRSLSEDQLCALIGQPAGCM
jgi:hypothetical protein